MRIVVLDAEPANPGDLSWDALAALGDLAIWPGTPPELVAERTADADVVVTNKVRLDADAIDSNPSLGLVCVLATGFDVVDIDAARRAGVTVCNVPGYATASTAQLAIALLLELAHGAGAHSAAVHAGAWCTSPTFAWWHTPQVELDGRTLLVVGMGAIGSRVARVADALGMRVIAAALPGRPHRACEYERVAFDDALAEADAVTLHCPLDSSTHGLIDDARLERMRAEAFLINTGRGPLVDEYAVARALTSGRLGGYAADVLRREPPPTDDPLLGAPRCILTPHLGWASRDARARLLDTVARNIAAWQRQEPIYVVS